MGISGRVRARNKVAATSFLRRVVLSKAYVTARWRRCTRSYVIEPNRSTWSRRLDCIRSEIPSYSLSFQSFEYTSDDMAIWLQHEREIRSKVTTQVCFERNVLRQAGLDTKRTGGPLLHHV